MGRMSELDAEIRQNADQQEETKTETSSLREAAQFVIDTVDIHGIYRPEIFEAFERLRDALAEPDEVLAEREACAGVCDALADEFSGDPDEAWFFQRAAAAIRARGNT